MSQYFHKMRLWAWRLAAAASLLVAVLAVLRGAGLTGAVIRALITWIIIYGLAWASIRLFEQTAPRTDPALMGRRIDVAVGLEDDEVLFRSKEEATIPGQVDPQLAGGLEDVQKQAEIVRRMGWSQQ